jgi:hypothetical protein
VEDKAANAPTGECVDLSAHFFQVTPLDGSRVFPMLKVPSLRVGVATFVLGEKQTWI